MAFVNIVTIAVVKRVCCEQGFTGNEESALEAGKENVCRTVWSHKQVSNALANALNIHMLLICMCSYLAVPRNWGRRPQSRYL